MAVDLRTGSVEPRPALGVVIPNYAMVVEAVESRLDPKSLSQKSLVKFDGSKGAKPKAEYHALLAAQSDEWHREQFERLAMVAASQEGRNALIQDPSGKGLSRG